MSNYKSFERTNNRTGEIEGLGKALSESYNATSDDIFGELLVQLGTVPETPPPCPNDCDYHPTA